MVSYLTHIREENKEAGIIYIFLDNAGYNRSYEVKEVAKSLGIELLYLPPYCPNLNLIPSCILIDNIKMWEKSHRFNVIWL